MDTKLIIIAIGEEILESFEKEFSNLGIHFYAIHNQLDILDILEFEAFVWVSVKFK